MTYAAQGTTAADRAGRRHVVVLGAGMAGLLAARLLGDLGLVDPPTALFRPGTVRRLPGRRRPEPSLQAHPAHRRQPA